MTSSLNNLNIIIPLKLLDPDAICKATIILDETRALVESNIAGMVIYTINGMKSISLNSK